MSNGKGLGPRIQWVTGWGDPKVLMDGDGKMTREYKTLCSHHAIFGIDTHDNTIRPEPINHRDYPLRVSAGTGPNDHTG